MQHLRANTEVIVTVGPFVDVGDGFTPQTDITLGGNEAELLKHGSTSVVDISGATWVAVTDCRGYYSLTLTTAYTNTEGLLVVIVQDDSDTLPVKQEYMVLSEAAWDSLYAPKDDGFMDVNVKTVGRADTQETEANNLEAACSNYSVTRGLTGTAVPGVAADGVGGLPISDAGGLDLDAKLANTNEVTAARMAALTDWIDGGRLDLILDMVVDTIAGVAGGLAVRTTMASVTVIQGSEQDLANASTSNDARWTGDDDGSGAEFIFRCTPINTDSAPGDLHFEGYYDEPVGATNSATLSVYNFQTASWDSLQTFLNATSDESHDLALTHSHKAPGSGTVETVAHTIGDVLIKFEQDTTETGDACLLIDAMHVGFIESALAAIAAVQADTTAILTDTETTIPGLIAALPTAANNADQVWDSLLSGISAGSSIGLAIKNFLNMDSLEAHPLVTRRNTAQSGFASTIEFDSGASTVDDYYNDSLVVLTNGQGTGQARRITDYVGSTRVATVEPAWVTEPVPGTIFAIIAGGAVSAMTTAYKQLVQLECQDAIAFHNLNHLMKNAVTGTDVADNSVIALLMSKSATADFDSYDNTTDSLEALADAAVAIAADLATVDTVVDAIKVITDALPDSGALTTIGTDTARLTAVRAAVLTDWINGGRLDLLLDAIKVVTDALPDSGALSDLATILADTGELQADDVPGLIAALNDPTAAAIVSAVWNKARSSHVTQGTFGESFGTIVSGAAIAGTLSTTEMTTDLTELTDDHYKGATLIWKTGVLEDQRTAVTGYDGGTKRLIYTAVTEAPSATDKFILV